MAADKKKYSSIEHFVNPWKILYSSIICATDTCLWDEFVDIVRLIVATCDFDQICENTL